MRPGMAYRIISFALVRRAYFLSPLRMNGISNDQDVMDYSLNKASEELQNSYILN
jgi:hypothetical protein